MSKRTKGTVLLSNDGRWSARLTVGYSALGNPKRITRKCRKDSNSKAQAELLLSNLVQENN